MHVVFLADNHITVDQVDRKNCSQSGLFTTLICPVARQPHFLKMVSEQMNLIWDKLGETAEKAFKDLRASGDFSDVTLAGADGKLLEAHKVVLSSCSPVLRTILLKINHAHPLLYLNGMNIEDIGLLLKFIYTGEVTLEKENLESFLQAANELQIAGLTQPADQAVAESNVADEQKEEFKSHSTSEVEDSVKLESESNLMDDQSKEPSWQSIVCGYPGCEKEFSTKVEIKTHNRVVHDETTHDCLVCSYKSGFPGNLKRHNQTVHGENKSITVANLIDTEDTLDSEESKSNACDRCGIETKSGKALMKHRQEEHRGQSFLCRECGKEFSNNSNMNMHKKSVHEHVKYSCDHCDQQFTSRTNLNAHNRRKHTS